MAGMRVGMVYSENRDLVQALDQLGCFHGVPGPTQYLMAQLLRDRGTHSLPGFVNVLSVFRSMVDSQFPYIPSRLVWKIRVGVSQIVLLKGWYTVSGWFFTCFYGHRGRLPESVFNKKMEIVLCIFGHSFKRIWLLGAWKCKVFKVHVFENYTVKVNLWKRTLRDQSVRIRMCSYVLCFFTSPMSGLVSFADTCERESFCECCLYV